VLHFIELRFRVGLGLGFRVGVSVTVRVMVRALIKCAFEDAQRIWSNAQTGQMRLTNIPLMLTLIDPQGWQQMTTVNDQITHDLTARQPRGLFIMRSWSRDYINRPRTANNIGSHYIRILRDGK